MANSITSGPTFSSLKYALDGLARQQEVLGQNIANVDTPNYKAQTVDFQSALKLALNNKNKMMPLSTTHNNHIALKSDALGYQAEFRQGGSVRADGNDVDIDVEMEQMTETNIQYQALTQMISRKYQGIKNIASGR